LSLSIDIHIRALVGSVILLEASGSNLLFLCCFPRLDFQKAIVDRSLSVGVQRLNLPLIEISL